MIFGWPLTVPRVLTNEREGRSGPLALPLPSGIFEPLRSHAPPPVTASASESAATVEDWSAKRNPAMSELLVGQVPEQLPARARSSGLWGDMTVPSDMCWWLALRS